MANTKKFISELCRAAIEAVLPENFIPAAITREGSTIEIMNESYDLSAYAHVFIISVGKAAVGMAEALSSIIDPFLTEGIVLTKHIPSTTALDNRFRVMEGGHPVPNQNSIAGAEEILKLLDKAQSNDLVFFLISGGGSALMTKPFDGINLETFQSFSNAILGCGADIREFNTLRKHLDQVKGGRLAQHAAPAHQITLILSDVVGSPLEVIASGPTVPDPSTYEDALSILEHYSHSTTFPDVIRKTLEQGSAGMLPETLKANDDAFFTSDVYLLAENRTAAYAATAKGRELGLSASVINTELTGDAETVGQLLPSFFSEMPHNSLLVFGGETTVRLKGNGLGGRNQELALAAVRPMADRPDCTLFTLATDGEDGPTNAAGAFVTSGTLNAALELGCDPDVYLRNNDSYHFFKTTKSLILTGPSGTNVNDLTFLLKE